MGSAQTNSYLEIEVIAPKHHPLFSYFRCNPKSCTNYEHFDDYLRYCAVSDHGTGMGTTHVICRYVKDTPVEIIGYVTLKAATLVTEIDEYDKSMMVGKPAIEISELAIKQGYERKGYGSDLLAYVARICKRLHDNDIGIYCILVYADPMAVSFYTNGKGLKFQPLAKHYVIPSEMWNKNCIPLYIKMENIYK